MKRIKSLFSTRTGTKLISISVLLIIFSASCTGSGSPEIDEEIFLNAVDTAVAATDTAQEHDAQETQLAEAIMATDTVAPTFTTAPDTATPEPTFTTTVEVGDQSPTATVQSILPSLSGPAVQVSVDTNCRSGPGKSYTWLGSLMVGEQATITGKDPSGTWWYITNPDQEGDYCWIWGYYATIGGNTGPLPIFTPGPTPTPDPNFSTAFHQVEACSGAWQIEFTIVNNGTVTLESVSTSVKDTVTGDTSGKSSLNQFVEKNNCTVVSSYGRLKPEDKGYTVSLNLPNNPTGNQVYAKITVCTDDDVHGDCRTRELYFTP